MTGTPTPALPHPAANRRSRLALVAMIVLPVGGAFVYTGGWLSPHALTQARIIDTFEHVNGVHDGFRRNHAKGVAVSGSFESNGQGARLSRAVVFRPGRVPLTGRFALAGGLPYVADAEATVRSLALRFALPNGEEWRIATINIPVFVVNNARAFEEQLIAMALDPATGKPDPARLKAFLERHPESAHAIAAIKAQPLSSGFADSVYNGLNAFLLTDDAGRVTPVRWSLLPVQPFAAAPSTPPPGANFLFDDLIAQLHRQPLQWRLVLTVGQPGDPTNDATVAWPADRERIDVGMVTVDQIASEQESAVRTTNFDPLVLPSGIRGSDDPLLSARSATYSTSFTRRVGEPVSPSAVTPAEVAR